MNKEQLMSSFGESGVAAMLKAGRACAGIEEKTIGGVPFLIIPEGIEAEKHEELLPNPLRIKANDDFEEPDSFCAYVRNFQSEKTRLYGNPDKRQITAIFDDHLAGQPNWREHTAALKLLVSPEWAAWMEAFKEPFDQLTLYEFLNDHLEQIADPDAGNLLADISTINIDNNWKCTSVQKEGGDIAFSYAKENTAKTATGKIPSRLTLRIAPFRSWSPISMTVYLSYRLKGESLVFTMRGHQVKELLAQTFNDVREHVQAELGLSVLV